MAEFYSLNPKLVMRYQPFMSKQLEKRQEDFHLGGWVFGQYFASAIGANFSKRAKYPKEPYYMMKMYDDEDEVHVLTDAERFAMFAATFNADHKHLKQPDVIDVEAKLLPELEEADKEGL